MKVDNIIEELKSFCTQNNKEDKEVYNAIQKDFLDGQIGVIMNKSINTENMEVYLYIKSKDNIVCPLLLKKFMGVFDAKSYYDEIIDLIENNSEEYIINRCKIGL